MEIKYRHNIMIIHSLSTFARVKGGYNQGNRDVYFVRMLGGNATLPQEIQEVDTLLGAAMAKHQLFYQRIDHLPMDMNSEDQIYYLSCYDQWVESQYTNMQIRSTNNNPAFCQILGVALKTVEAAYDKLKPDNTTSMRRNFIMKLIRWTDFILLHSPIVWNERACMKIVAENVEKVQEYLFYYMLTLIGADVMLMQTKQDITLPHWLEVYAQKLVLGEYGTWNLPPYAAADKQKEATVPEKRMDKTSPDHHNNIHIMIPERNRKTKAAQNTTAVQTVSTHLRQSEDAGTIKHREKSFEELALLASSIVMITIHDQTGEPIGSGSGIMIGKDGYILTNYHVVRGGMFYSVQIEDDATVYRTDELIKYHSIEDLAIIHIDRQLTPLPIYHGNQHLVRGQKVVAIGSPLGLFNSVSDGIISGFRTIDTVDMMQFTAPISHGSSGGAVLNLFGEVIGISTAGIDQGQNINLAVLYKTILPFIRGFY